MDAWLNVFTQLGFGVGMVVAIGFGFWRVCVWAGRELIIPTRDRFVSRIDKFFDRLVENLDRMEASLDLISKRLSSQATLCNGHAQRLDDIAAKLTK